ncbi:MAG: hypothetical protein ABEJ30_06130 [Halorientalis sp.]
MSDHGSDDQGTLGVPARIEHWGRRSAFAAGKTFLALLAVLVVLYVASFHAPAPAAERAVNYDSDAGEVLANATHNLRADRYRYRLTGFARAPDGERTPTVVQTRVVDNHAAIYTETVRTGVLLRNRSYRPARAYGTVTAGYTRRPPNVDTLLSRGDGTWQSDTAYRYLPRRNALAAVGLLQGSDATVVSETPDRFVARVDNRTVATAVAYPLSVDTTGEWDASLTMTVDKRRDRLTRAVFRYENLTSGRVVRATYAIHHGVVPRRPLGTYPPSGTELLVRLDRGARALDALVPLSLGGGRP